MALGSKIFDLFKTTAFRLAFGVVMLFIIAAAAIVFFLFWQTNKVLTDQALSTVKADISVLQREVKHGGLERLKAAIDARIQTPGPGLYFLADTQGTKISGNLQKIPGDVAQNSTGRIFRYNSNDVIPPVTEFKDNNVTHRLAFAIPVDVGVGRLYVGRDIEDQRSLAERIRFISLLGFGVLALFGLLGGLAVGWLLMRRVEAINSATQAIMSGDFSKRLPVGGAGDELDVLSARQNLLLDRIEELMSGLREVSDNIAHDLKTPLNRLRNRAEAALRDPRGAQAHREGLEATIEASDELIKTFNALLLIARLEAGALHEDVKPVQLDEVVRDVAELYEPVAEEANLMLEVDAAASVSVFGNRQLMTQAVANLIDNAIKYSSRQTTVGAAQADRSVQVAVRHTINGAEIIVADRGPGVGVDDRERVLKRFVRLEKSRTAPGTGLGLSLVAAVARLHKGNVRLEDNEPGLRVILQLPKALDKSIPGAAH